MSSCKTSSQEISSKALIPCLRSLLKVIHSLFQFGEMLRMMRILKSFRLFHLVFFLKYAILEGTFDIHLIEIESKMIGNGLQNSDGL